MVGVTLGHIIVPFAWQAWRLWHWAGSDGALVRRSSRVTPRHFAWQARQLVTLAFHLRGRRGTWRHLPAFGVAVVALGALGWLWC